MEEIVQSHITTILHLPHSVTSLLAEVLACKLHSTHSKGVRDVVCLPLLVLMIGIQCGNLEPKNTLVGHI